MGIKRDKHDKLVSDYVRLVRDKLKCQYCGKQFTYARRQGLHCSHLFSRRRASTRYDLANVFSHCYSCHNYLSGNPVYFSEWALKKMGVKALEDLKRRNKVKKVWKKGEKDQYLKPLKVKLVKAKIKGYK